MAAYFCFVVGLESELGGELRLRCATLSSAARAELGAVSSTLSSILRLCNAHSTSVASLFSIYWTE